MTHFAQLRMSKMSKMSEMIGIVLFGNQGCGKDVESSQWVGQKYPSLPAAAESAANVTLRDDCVYPSHLYWVTGSFDVLHGGQNDTCRECSFGNAFGHVFLRLSIALTKRHLCSSHWPT